MIALALLHPLRGYSQKYSFVQNKLGSPFGIIVSTSDTTGMGQVINECFALVDELNMVFSDYDPNSEVGKIDKLKAHQWSRVSKPLFDLLLIAQRAYFTSYKSFDVTIGNITKEWRLAKKENRLPQKKLLSDYHKYIGADQYILDENKSLIYKKNDKFSFDFGGIAKGYIADRVGELLAERGYSRHLIDAGGDLLCGASPVNSDGWKISLHYAESEKYYKTLTLSHTAIATSGMTYQHIDDSTGVLISHIYDPVKKKSTQTKDNITIITKDATTADWMATACSILPKKKMAKMLKKFPYPIEMIRAPRYE